MAIEKGKVLPKLLIKYKGTSATKNFLEGLATRYGGKLPDDADDAAIDAYINDHHEFVQESIAEADRRVTSATKKPDVKESETKEPETPAIPEGTPDWAKGLFDGLTKLSGVVTGMQAEKTQQTLSQRFAGDERLKGINPKLLKGRVPTTEEGFEAAVLEAVEDLKDFVVTEDAGGAGANATVVGKPTFGKDKPNFTGKAAGTGGATVQTAAQKEAIANVTKFTEGLSKEVKETKV